MTFQMSFLSGAELWQIEINGVLFAVSKGPSATKKTPNFSRHGIFHNEGASCIVVVIKPALHK
jgi:hypothetical protein